MTTTILIKRNADANYDRLWKVIDQATVFGIGTKATSKNEKETPDGFAVELDFVAPEVIDFIERKPKDFAIIEG